MNKKIIILFFILFSSLNIIAQNPISFSNAYGGDFLYSNGVKTIQCNNNYYLLTNRSNIIGNTRIYISKLDSLGKIIWENSIGGNYVNYATDFLIDSDKGFMISGYTDKNFELGYDVLLIKTDSLANNIWTKTYGGSDWDFGYSLIKTIDSNYVVAGETYSYGVKCSDVFVIKVNDNGDTLWQKVIGGDSIDYAFSVTINYDSNYIIGANTNSRGAGKNDAWVIKMEQNGDTICSKTYGGVKNDILYSIITTKDSAFAFSGSTESPPAILSAAWLVRTNKTMNAEWTLPQPWMVGKGYGSYNSVVIDKKGNYAMAGYIGDTLGNKDMYFSVFGEYFDYKCGALFATFYEDQAYDINVAKDSNYIITGTTGGLGVDFGISTALLFKSGTNCKLNDTVHKIVSIEEINSLDYLKNNFILFPNPVKDNLFIKTEFYGVFNIEIYDICGKLMLTKKISDINSKIFDFSSIKPGIYLVKTIIGDKVLINKVIHN